MVYTDPTAVASASMLGNIGRTTVANVVIEVLILAVLIVQTLFIG